MKKNILILAILILIVSLWIANKKNGNTEREILSAYTDGVISGADIFFYENYNMKYCSTSLLGKKCFHGKYELIRDTFYVEYSAQLPSITSTKMVRTNKDFFFLNEDNEIEYKFYLDRKYIDAID